MFVVIGIQKEHKHAMSVVHDVATRQTKLIHKQKDMERISKDMHSDLKIMLCKFEPIVTKVASLYPTLELGNSG